MRPVLAARQFLILCGRFLCLALLLMAATALLTGCGVLSEDDAPVSDSIMVDVLVDLHLASARQARRAASDSLAADSATTPAGSVDGPAPAPASVLAAHNLDRSAYEEAVAYYVDHPAAYGKLYDAVIERLSIERYARSDTLRADTLRRDTVRSDRTP